MDTDLIRDSEGPCLIISTCRKKFFEFNSSWPVTPCGKKPVSFNMFGDPQMKTNHPNCWSNVKPKVVATGWQTSYRGIRAETSIFLKKSNSPCLTCQFMEFTLCGCSSNYGRNLARSCEMSWTMYSEQFSCGSVGSERDTELTELCFGVWVHVYR